MSLVALELSVITLAHCSTLELRDLRIADSLLVTPEGRQLNR